MTYASFTAIALDLGTTSIKGALLDHHGELQHIVSEPAPPVHAEAGRCESDAIEYAHAAERVLSACVDRSGSELPLGMSCQRSSFLIWERASGEPVTPLISWQDNRGAPSCDELRAQEHLIANLTGLRMTPYYFAPKLRAVLRQHAEWRARLLSGEWLVGTLDSFVIWRWSGGAHFVTDASMGARTLLMDIGALAWSPALCSLFDIPQSILPRITPSVGLGLTLRNGLTLRASVGDQSAALIAGVDNTGSEAMINLGTGGFVVSFLPEGRNPPPGYLRTLVYRDAATHLAVEGTLNSIAAALAPYPVGECRLSDLATEDIFCLAEPSGVGAPYFRGDLGLRFSSPVEHLTPRQIAALLLEAIIFRVVRIVEEFHGESSLSRVFLSGGLSELVCLQQGVAALAPCEVYRLRQKESSLQGAALLASGGTRRPRPEGEALLQEGPSGALSAKYRRWKAWLDGLLRA